MTNQPPLGNYPPAGPGYAPPPVQALPKQAYTPWFARVLAYLIDNIPFGIVLGIGWALLMGTKETACITMSEYDVSQFCTTGASTTGQLSIVLAVVIGLVYLVWNYGYRQGTTGSSIGKSIMNFKVVSEKTGRPIGFGMSIVRQLAHIIDSAMCYIGYLIPLWDRKRQTVADKIVSTVCMPF